MTYKPRAPGFTLIELVLTIAIMGIVIGLVGPMLYGGVRSYSLVASHKAALAQVHLAMERMTYEIRLIPATANIDTWTASDLQFDLPTEANVRYTLSGTDLQRSGIDLASNVTSLAYTYYDSSGNPAAVVDNIYRICVEMTLSAGEGFGSITVRNTIFPRRFATAYANFE